MSVTVQDVLTLVEDYAGANTGQADSARKIRAIGNAVNYFKRKALLPSDEKIHSFYFSDDQFFYTCPADFMEEMSMLYNKAELNVAGRQWEYEEYSRLLQRSGSLATRNKWSTTTINGLLQLVLIGQNLRSGFLLDDMEDVGNWVVQGDASNLELDTLDFHIGDGCLSFDVSANVTGLAGINDPSVSIDMQSLFENHGYIKAWIEMPSASIDAIRLRLYTTATKYWTITATLNDDGTAFAANSFKKVSWALDAGVKTSTPEFTDNIIKIEIEFDLGAAVTGSNFRVDHIFATVPDYMDLVYRSNYKGTTAAGVSLVNFSEVTDKIGIGEMFPDFDDLIARRAALNLWPQLRGDKDFMMMYQSDLREMIKDIGLRFPRKRVNKLLPTRIVRD